MALTQAPAVNDLALVSSLLDEAAEHAMAIQRRAADAADHLGGSIPRGVRTGDAKEAEPVGMVASLLAKLARLRDVQNQTTDELGRINTFIAVPERAQSAGGLRSAG